MDPYAQLARESQRTYGVIGRQRLLDAGISSSALGRLAERGLLTKAAHKTYVFPGVRPSWEQSVMIAVTSAGSAALASHQTAAYLHRLTSRRPDAIEIVMSRWDRSEQPFVVHESLDLVDEDAVLVGSIPTTAPARTVVDLGASAPWLVESALDAGLRARRFTTRDIAVFVGRVGRRGRRGVGVIRPLLEARLFWEGITESELEDLFRRAWGEMQPPPTPQYVIRSSEGAFLCRTDFAFTEHRLRIELDSEAFHMDRPTFLKDRRVQNRTELLGWRTLRYTWLDLTGRPEAVVAEVQAALETRQAI